MHKYSNKDISSSIDQYLYFSVFSCNSFANPCVTLYNEEKLLMIKGNTNENFDM